MAQNEIKIDKARSNMARGMDFQNEPFIQF